MRGRSKFVLLGLWLGLLAASPRLAHPFRPSQTPPPAAVAGLLDINTATTPQLKALPGVGDAYAKRIVDGRPYAAKNQLVTRGVLPAATYSRIRDLIVAHQGTK